MYNIKSKTKKMPNNAYKSTDDISMSDSNKLENQLTFMAEKTAKLMEMNKQMAQYALEYNTVNNTSYNPSKEEKNIKTQTDSQETYSPTAEQKQQVDTMIKTINKRKDNEETEKVAEPISKDSNTVDQTGGIQIDLSNITSDSKNEKIAEPISKDNNTVDQTGGIQIDLSNITSDSKTEKVAEPISKDNNTVDQTGGIQIDLADLKSINEPKYDTIKSKEELDADALLNQAEINEKKDDDKKEENKGGIDLSNIM